LAIFKIQNKITMKNLLFILVLAMFGACQSECECKKNAENTAAVEAIYNAFAEGDVEAVLGAMADGIVWNEAENFIYADGNPYEGPQGVAEGVFGRLGAEWDNWTLEDKTFYPSNGSNVVVTGRYKATNKASGKKLDAPFVHLWTVDEGKVTRFQQYTDTKQAAEAVIVDEQESEEDSEE